MSLDPGEAMAELDEVSDRLIKAADQLHDATEDYERKAEAWDRTSLIAEAEIAVDAEHRTSERTRQGLILQRYREDPVYLEFVAARARKRALDVRYRALRDSVSANEKLAAGVEHAMRGRCGFRELDWRCPPSGPRGGRKHGHIMRVALRLGEREHCAICGARR